jgi:hypothetical protein
VNRGFLVVSSPDTDRSRRWRLRQRTSWPSEFRPLRPRARPPARH